MDNVFRTLYGDSFADRKENLDKQLNEIEKKYQAWFDDREDIVTKKKPDHLCNHYIFKFEPGRTQFFILKDSELPDYIKDECVNAFKVAFG